MTDWLTAAAARDYLGVVVGSEAADVVESCRKAAVAVVERERPDLVVLTVDSDGDGVLDSDPVFQPGEDVVHGTKLLIGRLYARKGTPQGIASFGELGAASILRSDPDVQLLLGLGRHAAPRIG